MQLRAAIAAEGADGRGPRRRRAPSRARHRVLVIAGSVVVLCALGAGIIALSTNGDDDEGRVEPAASGRGSTSTTAAPTCSGPLPTNFNIPTEFGSGEAGAAPESTAPVEPGQQVTHWSSDQATFEIRWPADAEQQKQALTTPQRPDDHSFTTETDNAATIDDKGVARRRTLFSFPSQVTECQTVEVTVYGKDEDAVNAIADAFNRRPARITEPLVTTTEAAVSAPDVIPCPGPETPGSAVKVSNATFVATVGGPVAGDTFTRPEDALTDFLANRPTLYQRGYQELQLSDGSLSFVAEPRPGAVVTVVTVALTNRGWTVTDWSASGC
jgi:hypothetical protein